MTARGDRLDKRNVNKILTELLAYKDEQIAIIKTNYEEAVKLKMRYINVHNCNLRTNEVLRKAEAQRTDAHKRVAEIQDKIIKEVYHPFLLRCHLMETIALHKSLDHPDVRGYRLPPQTSEMKTVMSDYIYNLREADDQDLKDLEDRAYLEDYKFETRTGSLDAWIDGETVPHPEAPDNTSIVPRRKRSRSPIRRIRGSTPNPFKGYDGASSSTDSGSQGFEIVPNPRRLSYVLKAEEVGYPSHQLFVIS